MEHKFNVNNATYQTLSSGDYIGKGNINYIEIIGELNVLVR